MTLVVGKIGLGQPPRSQKLVSFNLPLNYDKSLALFTSRKAS